MTILPHRYPFLLIDRVVEIDPGQRVVAIRNVTANEPQFTGHFPGRPIMPGVLLVESLAQAGAVAVLSTEENRGKLVLFAGIDECRFRRIVIPGDTLRLEITVEKLGRVSGRRASGGHGRGRGGGRGPAVVHHAPRPGHRWRAADRWLSARRSPAPRSAASVEWSSPGSERSPRSATTSRPTGTGWSPVGAASTGWRASTRATCPSQVGGEIKDFDAEAYMDRKDVRRHDRYVHYAWAASAQALADAGLPSPYTDDAEAERAGAIVATGIGGVTSLVRDAQAALTEGYNRVGPFSILNMIPDTAAGHVAIAANLRGPNYATVSACASSNHAIGEAAGIIRRGDADVMLAGGSEAAICEMVVAAFSAMRALSTKRNDDPQHASRPFDVDRDGFVIADGAGHDRARGPRACPCPRCARSGPSSWATARRMTPPT